MRKKREIMSLTSGQKDGNQQPTHAKKEVDLDCERRRSRLESRSLSEVRAIQASSPRGASRLILSVIYEPYKPHLLLPSYLCNLFPGDPRRLV